MAVAQKRMGRVSLNNEPNWVTGDVGSLPAETSRKRPQVAMTQKAAKEAKKKEIGRRGRTHSTKWSFETTYDGHCKKGLKFRVPKMDSAFGESPEAYKDSKTEESDRGWSWNGRASSCIRAGASRSWCDTIGESDASRRQNTYPWGKRWFWKGTLCWG